MTEARLLLEDYRVDHNEHRPHSALGQRAPAAFYATWEEER
jgi:transposase InsO family protein